MHKSVIEAADNPRDIFVFDEPAARARRVLAAQAKPEAISQGAIDAAVKAYAKNPPRARAWNVLSLKMRAALSAALLYIAGEE